MTASIEIGQAVESGLGGGRNGNSGIADGDSGVIDYENDGRRGGLGRRSADQDESDQGGTHAVVDILRSDAARWGLVFCGGGEWFARKAWTAEDAENFRGDR
jgi:hypothetical protein